MAWQPERAATHRQLVGSCSWISDYLAYRKKIPNLRRQLNLALRYHARKGSLRWVSLLMWASGNPRMRLPDIGEDSVPYLNTTALEEVCICGHTEVVDKIGIDPTKDNIARLLDDACLLGSGYLMEKLIALGADPKGKEGSHSPMEKSISRLQWQMEPDNGLRSEFKVTDALRLVYRIADLGGRWKPDAGETASLRRDMWHFNGALVGKIIRGFQAHHVCEPAVLLKLLDHPRIKAVLGVGHAKLVQMAHAAAMKAEESIGDDAPGRQGHHTHNAETQGG